MTRQEAPRLSFSEQFIEACLIMLVGLLLPLSVLLAFVVRWGSLPDFFPL